MQWAKDMRPAHLAPFEFGLRVAAHVLDREYSKRRPAQQDRTVTDSKGPVSVFGDNGQWCDCDERHQ
jgi:hypothetical protein